MDEPEDVGTITVFVKRDGKKERFGFRCEDASGEQVYAMPPEWETITGAVERAGRELAKDYYEQAAVSEVS